MLHVDILPFLCLLEVELLRLSPKSKNELLNYQLMNVRLLKAKLAETATSSSQKSPNTQFIVPYNNEKHQILISEKLELANNIFLLKTKKN